MATTPPNNNSNNFRAVTIFPALGNVVTGFEFPRARTPRGMLDTHGAETSLPVTIFPSWPSAGFA